MEEATGGMKNERHPGVGHVDVEPRGRATMGPLAVCAHRASRSAFG